VRYVLLAVGFFIATMTISSVAKAQEWVVCTSCVTNSQFELAAIEKHGTKRGTKMYAVGNFSTEKFRYVEVTYTPQGEVIQGNDIRPSSINESIVRITPNLGQAEVHVASRQSDVEELLALAMTNGHSIVSFNPSSGQSAQFSAVVSTARDQVLFTAPDGVYGFDSYQDAILDNPAGIDAAIRTALTLQNPAWVNNEIGANLLASLWNALEQHFGKGPIGCVIFYNGDSACFQINPMAPGALRVIDGTPKDIDGNEIAALVTTVPNGGGAGVDVSPNTPSGGYTGWGAGSGGGGSLWLFCATQGGKPVSCWIQYVQE